MKMWRNPAYKHIALSAALICLLPATAPLKAQTKKHGETAKLATVSGTVTGTAEFRAARVYFRNPERHMLYMVYTHGGKYEAMNLMPGDYEAYVQIGKLGSDIQKVDLKPGGKAKIDLVLHDAVHRPGEVISASFDEIYPPGEGKKIAERTCIGCHGANFIPSHQWNAAQWNGAINLMQAGNAPAIPPAALPPAQRDVFVKYLVDNFGPDSTLKSMDQSGMTANMTAADEAKLSKAEYIEFYFPPDPPGQFTNDPQYHGLPKQPYGAKRVGQDVVLDQHGYAWATDRGTPQRIARLDPRTGEWQSFLMPHPTKGIHDFIIDTGGMIWIPEWMGPGNVVQVFDTNKLQWVNSYPMDPDHLLSGEVHTQAIVIDSKHNVYMNWNLGSAMSRLDWDTKKAQVTLMPNPRSFLYGVVKDSKDNVWISEFRGGKVAKMDANTHLISEYTPLTYPAFIRRLTVDSDDNVWFDLFSAGKFGKLDTKSGKVTEWSVPISGSQPYSLKQALGSNKMWISDGGGGGALVLFDPATSGFTIFPTPQPTDQPLLRIARDGAVWYCPRSAKNGGIGVFYPDMTKVTTLAAYPTVENPNY